MLKATEYNIQELRKSRKDILSQNTDCIIITIHDIPKGSRDEISNLLDSCKTANKKIALRVEVATILKKDTNWLIKAFNYAASMKYNYFILPISLKDVPSFNYFPVCNMLITKINGILYSDLSDTTLLIENHHHFNLGFLSYIMQNLTFPDNPEKVGLSLDLDNLETDFYKFQNINADIIKYNVADYIQLIKTKKHAGNVHEIKDLESCLNKQVYLQTE